MGLSPAQYDSGAPATMMGPNSSGQTAAVMRICQPAWQLPMTAGLPRLSGCSSATLRTNWASARITSSTVWPGTGSGRKPTK